METKMLIGACFEAGTEAEEKVLNPRTGRSDPEPARGQHRPDRPRRCRRARRPLRRWSRTTPSERSAKLLAHRRCGSRPKLEELAQLEALNCGKPINAVRERRSARRRPIASATLRARCATCTASAAGEYMDGHTSMVRRDPIGVVASIAPWNYPMMMMAWKLAPGAGRRQHGGAEAVRTDAADGAEAGQDHGRHPARRRGQRGRRSGRERRQHADQPSGRRHGVDHRRRRHRQEGAAGGVENGQAHASGTGRQGARHRL